MRLSSREKLVLKSLLREHVASMYDALSKNRKYDALVVHKVVTKLDEVVVINSIAKKLGIPTTNVIILNQKPSVEISED